jgi:4-diphosphocytidyl-2-C-methyl-D-erythritol kinase
MKSITIKAHAKINLVLDVLYKREDNYHELDGIMHTIDLHDTVCVTRMTDASQRVSVICNEPLPHNNTAFVAATMYLQSTGITDSIAITIDKAIPSQAGLGSASADAAAVLLAMQALYNALNEKKLLALAEAIGADVPFCLIYNNGGCARASGKGERLEALPRLDFNLLIVKGTCGISTKELFENLNLSSKSSHIYRVDCAVKTIKDNDYNTLYLNMFNALENSAITKCKEIESIKNELLRMGARVAFMTGSGSAVVGIFEDSAVLNSAKSHFKSLGYYCEASKTI